jgi:hypothetical protein
MPGPPKFQALKRTVVKQVSEIEPTKAEVAQDFTKYVPISFNGAPPAPLEPVAAKPVLEARVAEVVEQEAKGPSIVVPEGYAPKKKGRKQKEPAEAAAPLPVAPVAKPPPVVKPVLGKVEDAAAAAAIQPADKELMEHFIAGNTAPKDPPLISPPEFVPASITFSSFTSIASALVIPPTLYGPLGCQFTFSALLLN